MSEELKPCAHCGSENGPVAYETRGMQPGHYVRCTCGIQTSVCWTEKAAIEAWNRRTGADEARQALARLDEAPQDEGWIACATKPPEDGQHVIAYVPEQSPWDDGCRYGGDLITAYYHPDGWIHNMHYDLAISHWRPLPQPPKQDGGGA